MPDRISTPASRQEWRVAQARAMAASIPESSSSRMLPAPGRCRIDGFQHPVESWHGPACGPCTGEAETRAPDRAALDHSRACGRRAAPRGDRRVTPRDRREETFQPSGRWASRADRRGADVFADGHDALACVLRSGATSRSEHLERTMPMVPVGQRPLEGARFMVGELGRVTSTRCRAGLTPSRRGAGSSPSGSRQGGDIAPGLLEGCGPHPIGTPPPTRAGTARTTEPAAGARGRHAEGGAGRASSILGAGPPASSQQLMDEYADKSLAVTYSKELSVTVDPEQARFRRGMSCFPGPPGIQAPTGRSPMSSGACRRLPAWGSTCSILPPIHPIGHSNRKGSEQCDERPVQMSPAARGRIGSEEGGHKSIQPPARHARKTFAILVATARAHGSRSRSTQRIQYSPDHPYASRASGMVQSTGPTERSGTRKTRRRSTRTSIPFDFETASLAQALGRTAVESSSYWVDQGVTVLPRRQPSHETFRLLGVADRGGEAPASRRDPSRRGVHPAQSHVPAGQSRVHPVVLVLRLAQHSGLSWRSISPSLSQPPVSVYFRANLWPNTPDILTEYLQTGGTPRLRRAVPPGRHARRELRHLRPRLRALREPRPGIGVRGIPRLGEIPSSQLGSEQPGQPARADHASQ